MMADALPSTTRARCSRATPSGWPSSRCSAGPRGVTRGRDRVRSRASIDTTQARRRACRLHARDLAARDYKRHMKFDRGLSLASVNQALAGMDHLLAS
jgi:hypothetical protein